ncbi:peptidylglycine alpha-hydroxylating monooxygenase-like [Plakobranchus ocellatus]|uniref:peptidylglycine monooxygenase n=1 Tax=Plakobranchus ocellatus TaxID=259542 RepID=A0AAV4DQV1_9GAST|nr:peptidylglycine alpha-hydroxylating monooxygenase-like [Plakobranchus ocellatus]
MASVMIPLLLSVMVSGLLGHPPPWKEQQINMLMPGVKPTVPDTYLCKSVKMEDDHTYITGFIPNADANIAHHVLLYGCEEPGAEPGRIWNCGEMASSSAGPHAGPCRTGLNILYAWAMEAPRLSLPPDVSFNVGQATSTKYLVVQVHYKNVSKFLPPENGEDHSGLTLVTTQVPSQKQAGVYIMSTGGSLPSHTVEYFEVACEMTEDVEIFPFAFRTHAHSLGRVISGYRIRDGVWTEIGRKDPRLPEMFYNATNQGISVRRGDILAARCTMHDTTDHTVSIGATQKDEMCNFYIMYYVNKPPTLQVDSCFSPGPPYWYWKDYPDQEKLNLDAAPDTASVIPGTNSPLKRNVSQAYAFESSEEVEGVPGRFNDVLADDIIDQAIEELDPQSLLYLVQELAEEEEWQQQQQQQQEAQRQEMLLRERQRQMALGQIPALYGGRP